MSKPEFHLFRNGPPRDDLKEWPESPPWRKFNGTPPEKSRDVEPEPRGGTFRLPKDSSAPKGPADASAPGSPPSRGSSEPKGQGFMDLVNAAIHLRRPLLVTGKPGTGKSSLAYAIARELGLGKVLVWPINSRSTLQEGLYRYDAIGRLQDTAAAREASTTQDSDKPKEKDETKDQGEPKDRVAPEIGQYIRLGPLGTALLPARRPRALLIDEIDKSDIDLPNDLLHVFEEGRYEIPELIRHAKRSKDAAQRSGKGVAAEETMMVRPDDGDDEVAVTGGRVTCFEFPIVVLTSNGEREFPAAFHRRCIRVTMPEPSPELLAEIVAAHFGASEQAKVGLNDAEKKALDERLQKEALDIAAPFIEEFLKRREKGTMATDQLLNVIRLAMSGAELVVKDDKNQSKASALLQTMFQPLSGGT